jgi:hypothetical protein
MAFWIVSNIVLNTLIGLSFSKDWTKYGETVMYNLSYVTEIPQRNKLVTIPQRVSFSTCKFHCKEQKCVAFFYIKHNETCLCDVEESASTEDIANSDQNSGLVYGLKKTRVLTSYLQVRIKIFL